VLNYGLLVRDDVYVRLYICVLCCLVLFSFLPSSAFILVLSHVYRFAFVHVKQLFPGKFVPYLCRFLQSVVIYLLHGAESFLRS